VVVGGGGARKVVVSGGGQGSTLYRRDGESMGDKAKATNWNGAAKIATDLEDEEGARPTAQSGGWALR